MLLFSCSAPSRTTWDAFNPNNWANRSIEDEPIMLDVAGPVAVDVESFNGNVVIEGNPKIHQARLTVVREGVHGYGRFKESKESLCDISYTAAVVPGELGPVLRVRTSTINPEPHFQRAHVRIELPDIEGVTVRSSNGHVFVRNISGPVDIATSNGEVRFATPQMMNKPVTIVNRNGDINYRIRGESTGRFDAETINGKVRQRVRYGLLTVQPGTTPSALHATLNSGTNPVTLRTTNGDIRIAVVSDPENVGDFIWD